MVHSRKPETPALGLALRTVIVLSSLHADSVRNEDVAGDGNITSTAPGSQTLQLYGLKPDPGFWTVFGPVHGPTDRGMTGQTVLGPLHEYVARR
ncbi:hypothetical protein VC83_05117 [Pseudogymnoascus destructans]|uniref:Uncharacterized protein n=2 Tax=Pseudogymnoascus destructans TaxID=655981 RepID=L8FZ50_PSED2|nr:uncharacterized protein VC83_05117 [Pseudogymnoascus destructans]ELR04996.1 hypothetical protein GMDG_01567 [Pseudogymnoascus destructans 20631-21]OAF58597.1 hypothetical protein VC83_05117 [Pseudogymnoascus destructans]